MTRSAQAQRRDWRVPVIVAAVIGLAVVAGLLLALVFSRNPGTGSADPSPSETPVASAPASEAPSAAPSEAASDEPSPSAAAEPSEQGHADYRDPVVPAPDGVLPGGGIVRVTADALRVREQPTTGAAEQDIVNTGDLMVVGPTSRYPNFGPFENEDYTWYPVAVIDASDLPAPGGDPLEYGAVGWVAVGDGEQDWVELLDPRCTDDEPTLQHLASLTEWERLACYGNQPLTVEGILGCGGCGGFVPGTWTPEWIATPQNTDLFSVEPQVRIGPMALTWSPDGPERPDTNGVAPILRVTGHFDDPAAAGCSLTFSFDPLGAERETPVHAATAEVWCRTKFVVETFEIIGEDEDFPFG
ncbi:MAG TPA: hypothetical protein VHR55_09295 [Candidatus Limnocylindria bacterium]|nr:hypothetical protein [Candidatus Limnocylindria bacterium]